MEKINQSRVEVAVLIPCYNEAATIGRVVSDFRAALPEARICVFDNNSTDATVEEARAAGAEVWFEHRQGKGSVVRRMFAEIEGDVYLMVDGDATYDAASAPLMVDTLVSQSLDMVVARRETADKAAYRAGHRAGNRLLTGAVAWIFGRQMTDILSGYRVMSRRFVKSFPAMTEHFGIETELTVHALQLRLPVQEVGTPYFARPEGSASKLNTWSDGLYILGTILRLFVLERPLRFGTARVLRHRPGPEIPQPDRGRRRLHHGGAVPGHGHAAPHLRHGAPGNQAIPLPASQTAAPGMTLSAQFSRFAIIGAAGFFVDVGVLYLLRRYGLDLYSARVFSFIAAATFTWMGNRLFTFRTASPASRRLTTEWFLYLGAMTTGGLVNYGVYALLVTLFALFRGHPWLAVAGGTGAGMLINFLFARRILYRAA
jgi:putative flippase GtrA